jgi:prepilin-type N-terminal cleavage/methylation domain-containing protein
MRMRQETGFTLIELLAVLGLLTILSVSFYSVLFSGMRSTDDTRAVVRQSEEARFAFNRMVRDVREADEIVSATPNSLLVEVDFDRNGSIKPKDQGPNDNGDYEELEFTFDESQGVIRLNGSLLMEGAEKVVGKDVFSYGSTKLEYDAPPGDGVVTLSELQAAQATGAAVDPEGNINLVSFALRVTIDGKSTEFNSRAELRNNR